MNHVSMLPAAVYGNYSNYCCCVQRPTCTASGPVVLSYFLYLYGGWCCIAAAVYEWTTAAASAQGITVSMAHRSKSKPSRQGFGPRFGEAIPGIDYVCVVLQMLLLLQLL